MSEERVKAKIERVLRDDSLTREERVERLKVMHTDARSEMRAATESGLVSDTDIGEELKLLKQVLETLDQPASAPEKGGGATL